MTEETKEAILAERRLAAMNYAAYSEERNRREKITVGKLELQIQELSQAGESYLNRAKNAEERVKELEAELSAQVDVLACGNCSGVEARFAVAVGALESIAGAAGGAGTAGALGDRAQEALTRIGEGKK